MCVYACVLVTVVVFVVCFTLPTLTIILLFLFARELYIWLEMVPSSGTDFRKIDAGAARYA